MQRLGTLAELIQGQSLSTLRPRRTEESVATLSVISTANIGDLFPTGPFKEAVVSTTSAERYRLEASDIVVPQSRRPLEASIVGDEHAGFLVGPNVAAIRLKAAEFDPFALAAILTSAPYRPIVEQLSAGSAAKNISLTHLAGVPIPPMEPALQQRIRDFVLLGHQLSYEVGAWQQAIEKLVDQAIEQQVKATSHD